MMSQNQLTHNIEYQLSGAYFRLEFYGKNLASVMGFNTILLISWLWVTFEPPCSFACSFAELVMIFMLFTDLIRRKSN